MTSIRKLWLASGMLIVGTGIGLTFAQSKKQVAPETLLPKESVLYVGIDGATGHEQAWHETAAYQALYQSGLMDVVSKLFASIQAQTGGEQGIPGQISGVLDHVMNHGLSLAVSLGDGGGGPPAPWAVIVIHDAAKFENGLAGLAAGAARGEVEFEATEQNGRSITRGLIPRTPGIEVGWWSEGSHLVIAAGMNAVDSALAVADGGDNITANPLWSQYAAGDPGFEVTKVGWLDVASLRNAFGGMPLPLPPSEQRTENVTVNDAATLLGLDGLNVVAGRSGYKGPALWSEIVIDAPGPRHGLLSLSDQESFTLQDLPPLPRDCNSFRATSFEWSRAYDTLLEIAHGAESMFAPDQEGRVDATLAQVQQRLGFDLKTGLFDALGNVHTFYADSNQMPFGLGFGLAIEVDDPDQLRTSLDSLLSLAEEQAGPNLSVRHVDRDDQQLVVLEFAGGAFSPTLCVGKSWLSVGIVPQTVEAFGLRESGKLPRWEPTPETQRALSEFPDEFTAVSVSDPRPTYQFLLGAAPLAMGAAQAGLRQARVLPPDFELSISMADIPPAELVVSPLFPNVSVADVDEHGMHYTSRVSLSGIPFAGAVDGGTAVTSTAVLTALLLPAVGQAREAARRTQSQNNLKQIMLAMHNYHDVFQHFPAGTYPNEKLKPDERLSWLVELLPYLDQAPLYNQIDKEEGWEDEPNDELMKMNLMVFQNPSSPANDSEYGTTDYVGLAGIGKEGPELPVTSPKAGVFAYDRATSIRDILDGTSNTIAVTDGTDPGPWGAGGSATIRPLTKKPYINGPDGIGGPHTGGINAAFCDGSVRFISENIDPEVFEALVTIRGGEVIGSF